MEQDSLPTEIILTHPRENLGEIYLDWMPQPGNYLDFAGKTYAVLERHHHYRYKIEGYRLHKISIYVQSAKAPQERTQINGHWIIGDAKCRFNARSELLRCAVNPEGPCLGCRSFEKCDP
jgi:hypothetical protein